MKSFAILVVAALACANAGVHPVEKVITLLKGLKATSVSEGQNEQVAYEKFVYWCQTSKADLKDAIAEEKETIDELEDTIAGKKKEKETLEDKISDLQENIKDLQASAKSAKDDRADEAKLYTKVDNDFKNTIDAVDKCIKALQGAEKSTEKMMLAQKSVRSLVALVSVKVSTEMLSSLVAFADPKKRPTQLAAGDEKKHVDKYDFKSENVIELLKTLKLKFEDDSLAATEAETNSLNAYALSKKARDNAISAANGAEKKKTTELGACKAALSAADKNLKDTNSDLTNDDKTLGETKKSCDTKASEWDERSKTRTNEIAAMDTAIKILGDVTGVRTSAPGNPIPPASPADVKFLQIDSITDPRMKAVALLRAAAKAAHSRSLDTLAQEVAAHLTGPFDAVNNMIEKMIFRLMDEQKQEDEHKLWCDEEMEKTNTMKDDKDEKIKDLAAEIKVETAAVGTLTTEIENADKTVANIVSFIKEATEIRNTGKSENKLAVKDAQDAQRAVGNAISVLETFYKSSGEIKKEPWEFIQAPVTLPKNPATWDSSYTGVSDPKKPGGIVSVLQAIEADFSKMEADTNSQEAIDQKEFEESMKTETIRKAGLEKDSEMKNAEMARRNEKITSLSSKKKDTDGELEKTVQYLKDLKPACKDGDSSYSDRKTARNTEITALKTSQVILQDAFKEAAGGKKFLQISAH